MYCEMKIDKEFISLLEKIAETHPDDTVANAVMDKLREVNNTYHFCMDFDGMVICDKDEEWKVCYCFEEGEDIKVGDSLPF